MARDIPGLVHKVLQAIREGSYTTYILQARTALGPHDLMDATPKVLRRMDEALLNEVELNCPDKVRGEYDDYKKTVGVGSLS